MQATSNDMDRRHCVVAEGGRLWMTAVGQRDVLEREMEQLRRSCAKTVRRVLSMQRSKAHERGRTERRMLKMKDQGA
jgi:hypothetical protein